MFRVVWTPDPSLPVTPEGKATSFCMGKNQLSGSMTSGSVLWLTTRHSMITACNHTNHSALVTHNHTQPAVTQTILYSDSQPHSAWSQPAVTHTVLFLTHNHTQHDYSLQSHKPFSVLWLTTRQHDYSQLSQLIVCYITPVTHSRTAPFSHTNHFVLEWISPSHLGEDTGMTLSGGGRRGPYAATACTFVVGWKSYLSHFTNRFR